MVMLFIYNINHIDIATFYSLFKDFNPRAGVIIKKKDKYGKYFGFLKVDDTIDLSMYNGMYIQGNKVYFHISHKNINIIKDNKRLKEVNRCNRICKNGKRCSRKKSNGDYCWQHSKNRLKKDIIRIKEHNDITIRNDYQNKQIDEIENYSKYRIIHRNCFFRNLILIKGKSINEIYNAILGVLKRELFNIRINENVIIAENIRYFILKLMSYSYYNNNKYSYNHNIHVKKLTRIIVTELEKKNIRIIE